MARCQQRHRVGWDAADGRNGGAARAVWETLLEMERFVPCRRKRLWSDHTVLDLVKAFERVSLPVVWAWVTLFNFP